MKPYYKDEHITIYHGDCKDVLLNLSADVLITDPVWPNARSGLVGQDDSYNLFDSMLDCLPPVKRMAIQLGCDSDPRLLTNIKMEFFRLMWLRFALPGHKGRLLFSGDVAYLYGKPPSVQPKRRLIQGESTAKFNFGKETKRHPCPRKSEHVNFLIQQWTDKEDVIIDPFCGSGTTLLCAKNQGRKAVGVEIEEEFCELSVDRCSQGVLF